MTPSIAMKTAAFIAALASGLAAQASCVQPPRTHYLAHVGETTRVFQFQNLKMQHFAHLEFVPFGTGIGAIVYFAVHSHAPWYGESRLWWDEFSRYGWDQASCEHVRWRTLAVWWDDRENLPRSDRLCVGWGQFGPVFVDLRMMPVGLLAGTHFALNPDLWIERQYAPPHWNQECTRPRYHAALIAPERGWW